MPDWDKIFREHGYLFLDSHPDLERIAFFFRDNGVQTILDIGCGTGRHLVSLSRLGFAVHGFDSSSHAIELSKLWLSEEGLHANVIEHLMEKPFPYKTDSFDAVISIQVIHHNLIKDIIFTVSEIERVLKPDGFVFITVPIYGPKPEKAEQDWQLEEIEEGTFIPQKGPESGIPHHYFTEHELLATFSSFKTLEVYIDKTDHRCLLARKVIK